MFTLLFLAPLKTRSSVLATKLEKKFRFLPFLEGKNINFPLIKILTAGPITSDDCLLKKTERSAVEKILKS
jgi:hypothetical protein